MAADLFRGVLPFVHVAELSSFRQAARRLGVTPAAVSKAVAALEDDLGVRLLERTSRRVALTPEGRLFLERCRDALAQLAAGRELVTRTQAVPKGELRVTLSFVLGPLLVRALPRFVRRHPAVEVRLQLEDRVSALVGEDLDVALRVGAAGSSSLIARRVRGTRWATVASPAYLGRKGTPDRVEQLTDHDCLRFVTPRGKLAEWSFASSRAGPAPCTVAVDQGELLVEAARAGLGVAQVLDFMVARDLREGTLVELFAGEAAEGPPITALLAPARRRVPKVRAFVDFVLEALGDAP